MNKKKDFVYETQDSYLMTFLVTCLLLINRSKLVHKRYQVSVVMKLQKVKSFTNTKKVQTSWPSFTSHCGKLSIFEYQHHTRAIKYYIHRNLQRLTRGHNMQWPEGRFASQYPNRTLIYCYFIINNGASCRTNVLSPP